MDTVSNLPFELSLIKTFPVRVEQKAVHFVKKEENIWKNDFCTLEAEENEELEILFKAKDPNAKLYLDALDIIPEKNVELYTDENGCLYKKSSNEPFVLYKSNEGYDALRVDEFKISISSFGEWYYGVFKIIPKPMSISEWKMMKEDLEKEIYGLTSDIINNNISNLGNKVGFPFELREAFSVIDKFSDEISLALVDIAENPKFEIKKEYEEIPKERATSFKLDRETIRRYLQRGGNVNTLKVPVTKINYDVQENRILRMIIRKCESSLNKVINYSDSKGIYAKYKQEAIELRKKIMNLKSKNWYMQISEINNMYIPHSFIMDSRYSKIYDMYRKLCDDEKSLKINASFSHVWKQSSYMYEMWCFLKVCRIILEEYPIINIDWNLEYGREIVFPFLSEGTKFRFKKENIIIEVVFDKILPTNKNDTSLEEPLFIAKNHNNARTHNRPDIIVSVFEEEMNWYLGSYVLECKYRKINSFWYENSTRSSRGQLETYYNNARSIYVMGDIGNRLQIRPVTKVYALTPDESEDGESEEEFGIVVKRFKASENEENQNLVKKEIYKEIGSLIERYNCIKQIMNNGVI